VSLDEITITESAEQLLELAAQQTNKLLYDRVKTLYMLKVGEAATSVEVAKSLGYRTETVGLWIKNYNQGGLRKLLQISTRHRGNEVPDWAIERLRQELQNAQFLPKIETIYAWLLTVGIKVGRDKAAEVHSWMKIFLDSLKLDSNSTSLADTTINSSAQLLIEPDIYIQYEHWKTEHGISNDTDALHRLMLEFFELNASDQTATSANNSTSEVITDDLSQSPTIDTKTSTFLNQSDLAKRLGVNDSVLAKNRNKRTFPGWTKQKDPDRISWQWVPNLRRYQSLPTN
jgi:transposase